MSQSLSERISAKLANSTPGKKNTGAQNLALVVVMQNEIGKAINDGWPLLTIWNQLQEEKRFPGSYQAFRRAWLKYTKRKTVSPVNDVEKLPEALQAAFASSPPTTSIKSSENGPRMISEEPSVFSFENLKKK